MVKENGETYEPHASIITRTNKKVKEIFKKKNFFINQFQHQRSAQYQTLIFQHKA